MSRRECLSPASRRARRGAEEPPTAYARLRPLRRRSRPRPGQRSRPAALPVRGPPTDALSRQSGRRGTCPGRRGALRASEAVEPGQPALTHSCRRPAVLVSPRVEAGFPLSATTRATPPARADRGPVTGEATSTGAHPGRSLHADASSVLNHRCAAASHRSLLRGLPSLLQRPGGCRLAVSLHALLSGPVTLLRALSRDPEGEADLRPRSALRPGIAH